MERNRDPKVTRLLLLRLLIVALAAILIGRLWQLQMVAGEKYRLLADANRLRDVDVPAPRGVIYDRNGEILARNRPSFTVEVVPGDLPEDEAGEPEGSGDAHVLDRLLAILERPDHGRTACCQRLAHPDPAANAQAGERQGCARAHA